MSARVRVTDRGLRDLLKRLKGATGKVAVGVLAADAGKDHGGTTLYDVAAAHEFGTRTIDQRSFLRETVDVNQKKILSFSEKQARLVVKGTITAEVALERVGVFVQGLIQERIAKGIPPALAQSTVARKGSSKPLIDSGQLRAGITHEVRA